MTSFTAPDQAAIDHAISLRKLTAEVRGLLQQQTANVAEVDRLNSENNRISNRVAQLDAQIRLHLWEGDPPPGR